MKYKLDKRDIECIDFYDEGFREGAKTAMNYIFDRHTEWLNYWKEVLEKQKREIESRLLHRKYRVEIKYKGDTKR